MLPAYNPDRKRCTCPPAVGTLLFPVRDARGRPRVARICHACRRSRGSVPLGKKPRRGLLDLVILLDARGVTFTRTEGGLNFQPSLPKDLLADTWHWASRLTAMTTPWSTRTN